MSDPETDTFLTLCTLFDTDLDTLMRGSAEAAQQPKDEAGYDAFMTRFAFKISGGVGAILAAVGLLCLMEALHIPEALGAAFHQKFVWYISGGVGAILAGVALLAGSAYFVEDTPQAAFSC